MRSSNLRALAGAVIAATIAGGAIVAGQQGQAPTPYPLSQTIRSTGQGVTAAFEGWYYDQDGSMKLLVGYFNRNTRQELDIPIGPNNRIEPGGPDQGQPTHFLPGRQFGVFAIRVPKDFGTRQLTWTLVANGQTNVIPMHLKADWVVEPFEDAGSKNTPPLLRFQPAGTAVTGPPTGIAYSYTATAGVPLTLTAWASDEPPKLNVAPPQAPRSRPRTGSAPAFTPPPPLAVAWSLFRGPGTVTFANARPAIDKADGKSATTATFSAPGDYVLRLQANDQSGDGGGGFQCCWTNAHVAVTVRPGPVATDKDN
jgi:hypothetical protein